MNNLTRIVALLFLFSTFLFGSVTAQEVYQHVSHTDIYDYLDELANAQIISINSAVKPYARNLIAQKLFEANTKKGLLNKRQKKELAFYLKDYNKELRPDADFDKRPDFLFYKDTLFTMSVNPVAAIDAFSNNAGTYYRRSYGADVFSYIGKNLGLYANFSDNYDSKLLADPKYLNQFPATIYIGDGISQTHESSEVRAGLTYSWEWGSIGLVKDHFVWGDNYNGSNIFSGHTPSFPHLRFHIRPFSWLDFNYVHGWLSSELTDSTESYFSSPGNHVVMYPKYVAANMVTLTPVRNFDVSIGNSVIYSDKSVQPAFLIPFFFYKSPGRDGDVAANWQGENHQVFLNVSSRQVKNVHLYTSLFIDETSLGNDFSERTQYSGKIGARLSNFMVQDVFLTAEYTRTNPLTYSHSIKTLAFASGNYNLGHYLGGNSEEIFLSVMYKPFAKFSAEISYSFARKGEENSGTGQADQAGNGNAIPFMNNVKWQASGFGIKMQYQVINDCYVHAGFFVSDDRGSDVTICTPAYFSGKRTTLNIGANIGF